jgi:Mg2+ and Co2+ transporter CorA
MTAKKPTLRLVGGSDAEPAARDERVGRVRANMQTFLFRSYDLIVESDEADLIRDVCLDIHKAEVKLKKVRQRLQRIQEQSAAQIRLLTAADTKLTAAIVAALLSGQR